MIKNRAKKSRSDKFSKGSVLQSEYVTALITSPQVHECYKFLCWLRQSQEARSFMIDFETQDLLVVCPVWSGLNVAR